jgi:hypothetical protein
MKHQVSSQQFCMSIHMTVTPLPPHKTPNKPIYDQATATWQDQQFIATSTHGSSMALARKLVAAGCPEQPWEAYSPGGQRLFFGPSLHRLAGLTIHEFGRRPIRLAPFTSDARYAPL